MKLWPCSMARSGVPVFTPWIARWCRTRIADYKAPERLVVLDALPLNATNKVDKTALAAMLTERSGTERD